MKYILTILFFVCLSTATFSKGGSGTYYIKGTAYGADKIVLNNVDLLVDGTVVKTNDNGQFEIAVQWESACPSQKIKKYRHNNKILNPKYIVIRYGDKELKLKNRWKKYGDLFSKSKDKVTRKKDLHFT